MANNEDDRRALPPYIPFKTLVGFIERLKETVVPNRIDPSLLRNYSGSVGRQLIAALKFLGLIEEGGAVTDRFKTLVASFGTPQWKEALGDTIIQTYSDVTGDLDLDTATPAQLEAAFRRYGADGDMMRKCVGFWMAAMTSAGYAISPHILNKPRAKAERNSRRRSGGRSVATEPEEQADALPPSTSGTVRFSFPIPGKPAVTMFLPSDLGEEDWEMVDAMMKAYIQRRRREKSGAA